MLCHWLFSLFFLITVLLVDFATHVATTAIHWDEMLVKNTWNTVPANWESFGNTTAGSMVNLHIALKPDREGALIDTLYEVSDPENPRQSLITTPPLTPLLTCVAPFQIWRISFSGTAC